MPVRGQALFFLHKQRRCLCSTKMFTFPTTSHNVERCMFLCDLDTTVPLDNVPESVSVRAELKAVKRFSQALLTIISVCLYLANFIMLPDSRYFPPYKAKADFVLYNCLNNNVQTMYGSLASLPGKFDDMVHEIEQNPGSGPRSSKEPPSRYMTRGSSEQTLIRTSSLPDLQ